MQKMYKKEGSIERIIKDIVKKNNWEQTNSRCWGVGALWYKGFDSLENVWLGIMPQIIFLISRMDANLELKFILWNQNILRI